MDSHVPADSGTDQLGRLAGTGPPPAGKSASFISPKGDPREAGLSPKGAKRFAFDITMPQVASLSTQAADKGHSATFPSGRSQVSDQETEKPYFMDIFCGTAGVTAAIRRIGADAMGFDHVINKHRMKGPAMKMDLTLRSNQLLVLSEIRQKRVKGVTLAPPCGTASKARSIPLRCKKGRKLKGPRPLRSHAYPQGIPGLKGVDRTRVLQANKLYKFTREVMDACEETGTLCMVENPENSLMWVTKFLKPAPKSFIRHCLHACMYGSKRLKKTAFLINFEAPNMVASCDGSHPHLPWSNRLETDPDTNKTQRVFDTASEAEYPKGLCDAIAAAFSLELQSRGVTWNMEPSFADEASNLAAQKQPRGHRSPNKVPNTVNLPDVVSETSDKCFGGLPLGSKLVNFQHVLQEGGVDAEKCAVYGVHRTPQEFLDEALKLRHPFNIPVANDFDNINTISKILSLGKLGVMKARVERLLHYKRLAVSLESQESALKDSMHPDVRTIMNPKRLLLFRQMLVDADVGDEQLFDAMVAGFRLTWLLRVSSNLGSNLHSCPWMSSGSRPSGRGMQSVLLAREWPRTSV